ncbi:ATP-binding protein [Streptosporangium jomthongense]|uniref:ATP-binding protein n=1 Tax=Streptosporangium jomthongense TaxID=1193683 RepID=A0ABV8ETG5_9ACTN
MEETRTRRDNVPAETGDLVGREAELGELAALIGHSPLVTLTGVAGVGKSRLALRAATTLRGDFPDGVWVVALSAEQNGALVGHAVAAALGLPEQAVRPQAEVLADFLADRRLLLVLDDCDHLAEACAELLRQVLARAPHIRVLATGRGPLGLAGERLMPVEPFAVPEGAEAATCDAVRLFTERARALVPGAALDPHEVARLCRGLDGIPLAIELAVRRLRALSVPQLTERLGDRFALLEGGSRAPLGRHRSMRTAVGLSHELCGPGERLLWARLSVFEGWFDADDAWAVCADGRLATLALSGLADRSILVADVAGGPRYRMLGTIRDYGRQWLRLLGEEETVLARHHDHFLAGARRAEAEWYGPSQARWAAWARRAMPDLEAALARDEGFDLATSLWFVWCCLGRAGLGHRHLDRLLNREITPGPARTKALWVCSWAALAAGDTSEARRRAAEAYAAATAEGDLAAAGCARQGAAATALALGDLDGAARLAAQAAGLFEQAAPERAAHIGLPVAETTLAMAHSLRGEFGPAVEVLVRQWARCAERGELWARSHGDHVRSLAELGRGEIEAAEAYARAALDAKWCLRDPLGVAAATDQLAATAVARGDGRRAARLLGAAARMWTTAGLPTPDASPYATSRARTERRARALLGDLAYERAFARGMAMDIDTTVARIRDTDGFGHL